MTVIELDKKGELSRRIAETFQVNIYDTMDNWKTNNTMNQEISSI